MIAHLEGVLREISPTRVVVDVGGVGYEVHVPLSTFAELPDAGKTVALHVYTHAREGAIQLFGFATPSERAAFALLLHANRVGPRLAQTVLSGIGPPELLEAIRSGKVAALRAVPGIGTRMAERILVELRDRTAELQTVIETSGARAARAPAPSGAAALREQTLSALANLGYSKSQAEQALAVAEETAGDDPTLEDLVRGTLKGLAR